MYHCLINPVKWQSFRLFNMLIQQYMWDGQDENRALWGHGWTECVISFSWRHIFILKVLHIQPIFNHKDNIFPHHFLSLALDYIFNIPLQLFGILRIYTWFKYIVLLPNNMYFVYTWWLIHFKRWELKGLQDVLPPPTSQFICSVF